MAKRQGYAKGDIEKWCKYMSKTFEKNKVGTMLGERMMKKIRRLENNIEKDEIIVYG